MTATLKIQILISICLLCFSFRCDAQETFTDKGIYFARSTGNLNYDFSSGKPLDVKLGLGYFLLNDIVAGVDLDFSKVGKYSDIALSPFLRYYLYQYVVIEGNVSIRNDEGIISNQANVGLGYIFMINDYCTLEPAIFIPLGKNEKIHLNVSFSLYL